MFVRHIVGQHITASMSVPASGVTKDLMYPVAYSVVPRGRNATRFSSRLCRNLYFFKVARSSLPAS